jgi:hypothetical protein
MRSVCKTLLASGFDVNIFPTQKEEDRRNLLFAAYKSSFSFGKVTSAGISDLNVDDAIVLEDEKPQLEILNAAANKRWREACMKYFLSGYYSGQDKLIFR